MVTLIYKIDAGDGECEDADGPGCVGSGFNAVVASFESRS